MKNYPLLILCFFCAINSFAQESNQKKIDTTFIDHYTKKISLRVNASTDIQKFRFDTNGDLAVLSPNEEIRTSIFLDYKFLGVSFGFSPKFLPSNNDDESKGETEYFNLGFQFKINQWIQKVYFEKVKGFFVENTRDLFPNFPEEIPFVVFSNLKIKRYGGFTSYLVNPNFSFAAINGYYKRQLKSAGSFIPKLEYNYTIITNQFDDFNSNTKEINISPIIGYYYTFVYKKNWIAGAGLSSGLNFVFDKTETQENVMVETTNDELTNLVFQGEFNLGYHTDGFYGGLNFNFDNLSSISSNNNESLAFSRNYFQFYLGYHFNSPQFLENAYAALTKPFTKKSD